MACTLVGKWPTTIDVTQPDPAKVLRVELLNDKKALIGQQFVFVNAGNPNDSLLSSEAFVANGAKTPLARCSADSDTYLRGGVTVDNGPEVSVEDMYLGKGSLTISFYAYWEDLFDSTNEKGLLNQLFGLRLDGHRPPMQVQITAKPGQGVTLRLDGVSSGHHELIIEEIEALSPKDTYQTPLQFIEFNVPAELGITK